MKKTVASGRSNPTQVRGDIQAGLTGDKRPGFGPALAPLETDAEAAGTPMTAEQVETAHRTQRAGRHPEVSGDEGSAMRPVFPANHPLQARISVLAIVLGLCAIAFLLVAVLGGLGMF